jgi:hypothetical protein
MWWLSVSLILQVFFLFLVIEGSTVAFIYNIGPTGLKKAIIARFKIRHLKSIARHCKSKGKGKTLVILN